MISTIPDTDSLDALDWQPPCCHPDGCERPAEWIARCRHCNIAGPPACTEHKARTIAALDRILIVECAHCHAEDTGSHIVIWEPL